MSAITDLIDRIPDEVLRKRLQDEINRALNSKKFGLVFEEHLPECTPLFDVKIKRGSKVSLKNGKINDTYTVLMIKDTKALCLHNMTRKREEYDLDELVSVAQFGEPIYPHLISIDSVNNAPDSELWHTLIQADNYHALQLLEYLYLGKVDCIYIDPPYNTGARDWKYNNDYVETTDSYRHSKWLSMMKKRLLLAKKLLNPKDSVMIVTIDEKEYLHLGCLLEELFPEARIQMVSSLISPQGNQRKNQFSRIDEYLFFIEMGNASVQKLSLTDEWRINADDKRTTHLHWQQLIRNGKDGTRKYAPYLFYPIYVSKDGKKFKGVGKAPELDVPRESVPIPDDVVAIWPLHSDGTEGRWACKPENLLELQSKGYVKLGKLQNNNMYITYLQKGMIEKVENGDFIIDGYAEDGSIISSNEFRSFVPGSQWRIPSHDASRHGSILVQGILGDRHFPFPKSLYAVHDAIRFFVANKPNALVLDFFAGSGTTLHAVNLLNAEDGGKRQCIMVTNNEVSDDESKQLRAKGYKPGDSEWEKFGIADYVTWPRTKCSINGIDINGNKLREKYLISEIPMSDGFHANCHYFKLGFLDKDAVAIGKQFKELIPILWMKSGCHNTCPIIKDKTLKDMYVFEENNFAVLLNENKSIEFIKIVNTILTLNNIFIVTDSESSFKEISQQLVDKKSFQLYRDYLDNFRINKR